MRYVKLKQAGESITLGVDFCQPSETGQYPEIEFTGIDGAEPVKVQVPKASCDRQMARLGIANYEGFAGKIVTISRDPNTKDASKPYWGITIKGAKQNGAPKPVAASPAPNIGAPIAGLDYDAEEPPPVEQAFPETSSPTLTKLDALFGLYDVCWKHAALLAMSQQGLNPDVSAMTATLFIAAQNNGIKSR